MGLQQTYLIHNNEYHLHYYCVLYRSLSARKDSFSHSLLKFKQARQPDLAGWIDCALELFGRALIPGGTVMVRALHHHETRLPVSPMTTLDQLGIALATEYHLHYHPRLLQKITPILPVKRLPLHQRSAQLLDNYAVDQDYAASLPEKTPENLLIIDDVLTTGTTIRTIISLLKRFYNTQIPIYCFTLARADDNAPQLAAIRGQNFQLQQGLEWQAAPSPDDIYPPSYTPPIHPGKF